MCHLIFAACYVRDTYFSRHFYYAIFWKCWNLRNQRVANISCNKGGYEIVFIIQLKNIITIIIIIIIVSIIIIITLIIIAP